MKLKLKHYKEESPFDCAVCSLKTVFNYYKIPIKSCDIESKLQCSMIGTQLRHVELFLAQHGLKLRPVSNYAQLSYFIHHKIPVLAKRHLYRVVPHYCIICGIDKGAIIIDDPYFNTEQRVPYQRLKELEMYAVLKK